MIRAVLRVLGSWRLAAALLTLLGSYLAVVSVLAQAQPDLLEWALRTSAQAAYRHGVVLVLAGLLGVNLTVATVTRIEWTWARGGAWLSHAGVLALGGGAVWYAWAGQSGQALSWQTGEGWTPVREFYEQGTLHVRASWKGGRGEADLSRLADAVTPVELDIPLGQADGVDLRVRQYLPLAQLGWMMEEKPGGSPMAAVQVSHGSCVHAGLLSPDWHDSASLNVEGVCVLYHPRVDAATLERMLSTADVPRVDEPMVMIVTGPDITPAAIVLTPDGRRTRYELALGAPVELPLPAEPLRLTLLRISESVVREESAQRVQDRKANPRATPVVRVEASAGGQTRNFWLALDPAPRAWRHVDLPGGAHAALCFSRRPVPLDATLQITRAVYESHGGSVTPRDYICDVDVRQGGQTRSGVIRLNGPMHVGPWQVSQGAWMPNARDPRQIAFEVASRPGLWVIWTGMAMIVAGMLWGFYVRPVLERRRATR